MTLPEALVIAVVLIVLSPLILTLASTLLVIGAAIVTGIFAGIVVCIAAIAEKFKGDSSE